MPRGAGRYCLNCLPIEGQAIRVGTPATISRKRSGRIGSAAIRSNGWAVYCSNVGWWKEQSSTWSWAAARAQFQSAVEVAKRQPLPDLNDLTTDVLVS